MKTVYQGLAIRDTLTHFRLQFPSSRIPRPTVLIPGMPRLKSIHISNLDPLCYNDDISLLICEARGLEALNLHWSPRMRNVREPSVYLQNYLGRLAETNYKLRPKELQFFNMFARNDGTLGKCIAVERVERLAFLNCMEHDDPTTVFVDNSWVIGNHEYTNLKMVKRLRADRVDKTLSKVLKVLENLEEIYLINARNWRAQIEKRRQNGQDSGSPTSTEGSTPNHNGKTPSMDLVPRITIADLPDGTPVSNPNNVNTMDWRGSSLSPDSSNSPIPTNPLSVQKHITLASDFIAALTKYRGPKIRKLLLRDTWNLGREVVSHLIASCPNLEQLGIAIDFPSLETVRWITSSLPKLKALRMLIPIDSEAWRQIAANAEIHNNMLELETWKDEYKNLVWLGIGGEIARLDGREKIIYDGKERYRGLVKVMTLEEVKHVEIFGLDTLEE
jgi:hypothetical protein